MCVPWLLHEVVDDECAAKLTQLQTEHGHGVCSATPVDGYPVVAGALELKITRRFQKLLLHNLAQQ